MQISVIAKRPAASALTSLETRVLLVDDVNAALAANAQVVAVLRLVGATDRYIAEAFIRRFTIRAFIGAGVGVIFGMLAVLFRSKEWECRECEVNKQI